jgi:flagellar basal body rod protein FlgC
MNIHKTVFQTLAALFAAALITSPSLAQLSPTPSTANPAAAAAGQPNAAEMQKMMEQMAELGKPGENHKLLEDMAGNWTYKLKMWMDPAGEPQESKGTATRKAVMGGRYFIAEHTGKFQMPGKDGKMETMNFKGMAIEGYDNAKKKFVSSWIDNMSTMIMNSEGTYDPTSQTFTYNAECQMMPGKMTKIREVVKVVDKDHHTFEWYDDSHGAEAKTMEISYTRKK